MAETNFFWEPISDNIFQERDDSGVVTADYTTEPELYGNVVSQKRSGVESQLHYDALGTTLVVTSDNEGVTDTRAYTALGETTEQSGSMELPHQYVGRKGYYREAMAATYIVRRRVYAPVRGRWIAFDPLGVMGAVNLFLYVSGNPITRRDPSGMECDNDDPCKKLMAAKDTTCKGLMRQAKPPPYDPRTKRSVLGLAFCEKGKIKYEVYDVPQPGESEPSASQRGDPCVMVCVREHEVYHEKQLKTWCPWICECYKDETFDVGYIDDGSAEPIWECPAYIVALLCLKKFEMRPVVDGKSCNRMAIRSLIEQLEELLDRQCKGYDRSKPPPDPPEYPK